jgi:hypothetical protein
MKSRLTSTFTLRRAGLLVPLALIAIVVAGSAQARPSTKKYDASVVPASAPTGGSATFTLRLTNETASQQTLGSANFTVPSGWAVTSTDGSATSSDGHNWDICAGDGFTCGAGDTVVQFRAASNSDALSPGAWVEASATTSISCPAPAEAVTADSTWTTAAKQSNDFSGQPGNDFALVKSDLDPLGSFTIGHIDTQITNQQFTVTVTAHDTCGATKTDYNGGGVYAGGIVETKVGLTGASIGTLSWSDGVGSQKITAKVAESGNSLTFIDHTSGISSTSNLFNVVDVLCTSGPCHASNKTNNPTITADSPPPPDGASLGLGFNPHLQISCTGGSSSPIGGAVVLIDPAGYLDSDGHPILYTVTLTYSKSVTGTGPPSSFAVCLSKDNGATWGTPLPACTTDTDHGCIVSEKRVTGGALEVVLRLIQGDPYGGLPQ